jgi:uncharacterized Zn finger protein
MILIACESCGSVVDLVVLRKNEKENKGMNSSYSVKNKEYWQCRSCAKRNEVKDENIFDTSKK